MASTILKRWLIAAAAIGLNLVALATGGAAAPACPDLPPGPRRYAGQVSHYLADLKTSFPEHQLYSSATALTGANYRAVLDGLVRAGVNGIRLPIVPAYAGGADYPAIHGEVSGYARSLGLTIYASPLAVGRGAFAGWSDDRYASWIAAYAQAFRPDVLSPFNEAGFDNGRIAAITEALRAKLGGSVRLMGPDRQHVDASVASLGRDGGVAGLFDIVGAHNANRDRSATAEGWSRLAAAAGRPVWSSENPAGWARGRSGDLPGLEQAVAGGVEGIVVWMAKPGLVDGSGRPTAKACEIASHLVAQ